MSHARPGSARRTAFSVVAVLAAALTLLLTIGSAISLLGPDQSPGVRLAMLDHLPWLSLGWCAAFAVLIRGGARRPAAMQQVLAMLVCLYVDGGLIAHEPDPVFYLGFGLVVGLLVVLHPDRRSVFRAGPAGLSPGLLVLSLVALGPLLVYASHVMTLGDPGDRDAPFYTGIAATATAVPFLVMVASLRARWFRLPGWSAAAMLAVLGVSSLLFDDPGALPGAAAAAAVVGAVGLGLLVERNARGQVDPVATPVEMSA